MGKHQDGRPRDDDDDAGECKVPVALKDPKQVSADSLQSPHDPDVTYSGHKGKGYEVQVAETYHLRERHPAHHPRGGDPLEWERHRRERAGR